MLDTTSCMMIILDVDRLGLSKHWYRCGHLRHMMVHDRGTILGFAELPLFGRGLVGVVGELLAGLFKQRIEPLLYLVSLRVLLFFIDHH